MKTVSIIRADNMVVIDGKGALVDCSSVDPVIHAIQWNEEKGKGSIEFVDDDPDDGIKEPNQPIDSIEEFRPLVSAAVDALAQLEQQEKT